MRYAIAKKIRGMRIFPDSSGKMNLDVVQAGGGVLVVSNFTLFGDVSKGRRPTFAAAADPALAEPMYEQLCARLRDAGLEVQTGRFGARMSVAATNDGPINILVDSKRGSCREQKKREAKSYFMGHLRSPESRCC